MALNFPSNPTVGQTYQEGSSSLYIFSSGSYWEYGGPPNSRVISASYANVAESAISSSYALTASFALNGGGGGASVLISASAPASQSLGTLWFNTRTDSYSGGELYIQYDNSGSTWVPAWDGNSNFATSSSLAASASLAVTASHAISASFAVTASSAVSASQAISASFALTASSAVSASRALSSSFVIGQRQPIYISVAKTSTGGFETGVNTPIQGWGGISRIIQPAVGSGFNAGTGIFTAPRAGLYKIEVQARLEIDLFQFLSFREFNITIQVNGVEEAKAAYFSTVSAIQNMPHVKASLLANLGQGNEVRPFLFHNLLNTGFGTIDTGIDNFYTIQELPSTIY